jgi:hypothetical protein
MHFGRGGLVDYVLHETKWRAEFGPTDFVGRHHANEGGYMYEAPMYWWDMIKKRFDQSGLKRNLVIR